ncbi:MAG TPA: TonB-dependent receptor [Acidisarcina sp.]
MDRTTLRTLFRIFLLPLFLTVAIAGAHAQQNSTISGTVVDQSGGAIPGAQVTLTQIETGFVNKTTSNGSGLFSFPALNVGSYDLSVTAPGFETYLSKGIVLDISQTVRADVHMTVGAVNSTVSVTADELAPQTDSNVVSTLINAAQISELATENRNFAALVALGMGVSSALPDSNTPTSVAASFTISVNGLRQSHNIWLIDGGEADDRGGAGGMDIMPSQDAIAEFETLASNYPPDYGISSGATISLGLKSGTQKFHGELFEFNRNTVFDANNYFNKQNGTPRTKLNYNIFGGNIGGPIFIPHLYNNSRNRTFFFWNEEWRRLVQGSSPTQSPTLAAADFPVAGQNLNYVAPVFEPKDPLYPNAVPTLVVPTVGDPVFNAKLAAAGLVPGMDFPGNVIPSSLLDLNAIAYLNTGVIPKPTLPNGDNLGSANQPITVRDDVVRIDHRFNDKWQILGHYLHDSVLQAYSAPMLGWSGASYNTITSTLSNPANSAAIKLSGTISPTLLVEASMNYDGNVINIVNSPNSLTPSTLALKKYFPNNGSTNLPNMHFNGFYSTQENPGSAPWHNAAQDYDPKVDISWTHGKHQMKFGYGYNRYTKNQQLFGNPGGDYSFSGQLTSGTTDAQHLRQGDAFVDFLLGLSSGFNQTQSLPIRHYVNFTNSVYANDNWHAMPRLTLQLGFRYDALPHAYERANQVANFDPAAYQANAAPVFLPDNSLDPTGPGFTTVNGTPFYLNGIQIAGQNLSRGLVKNYWATFQPRVGFSWDIFGTGRTVLRGGVGTFYERLQGNDIYNAATNEPFSNQPSASNVEFTDPHTSFVTGATAASPIFPQPLTTLALNYPAPGVAQYSLGVQHQLAPSVVLITQYVGNTAYNQNIDRNINTFPLTTPLNIRQSYSANKLSNPALYRNYVGYNGITQQENSTSGNYNSFQAGVRAQNRHGLSGEIDYTWSHEIDITSYDLNTISNPFNPSYDRGSGALDRRHILNFNYIYALPKLAGSNGLVKELIGGWEIAGTGVFESGTIIANQGPSYSQVDTIGLGGGYTNRPDKIASVKYPKKQSAWFDPSSFAAPLAAWAGSTTQGFGNAGKDSIIGPGRVNFTTSLYKTFAFTEDVKFQFRAESFNTFNHTEFNGVASSFGSNFGQVTSTYDPRTLELGGRLSF